MRTHDFIIVQDEQGFFRLLKFNDETNSYSDLIDRIRSDNKETARQRFLEKFNVLEDKDIWKAQ